TIRNLEAIDITTPVVVTLGTRSRKIGEQTLSNGIEAESGTELEFRWDTSDWPTGRQTLYAVHNLDDDRSSNNRRSTVVFIRAAFGGDDGRRNDDDDDDDD